VQLLHCPLADRHVLCSCKSCLKYALCYIDENNPTLTEIEAALIQGILATFMMYWWKYYDLNWTRSWVSAMNSYYVAVVPKRRRPNVLLFSSMNA